MSSTFIFIVVAATVVLTSFISGILGMAGGMILVGVLLALLPVPAAMMLHGITQVASNGGRAWLWRAHVNWRIFFGFAIGSLLVLLLFTVVRFIVSKPVAYIILGLTPFIGFLLPKRLELNVDTRGHPFGCGVICTGLQLLAGVSGPLLDVFFVRSSLDRRGVVATKAMSQTLSHFIKIGYFAAIATTVTGSGGFPPELSIALIATSVVLAFVGTSLARQVLEKVSDANFRRWTQWTVLTMGVLYLATGIWKLL